jgi:hypothetical protein
MRVAISAAAFEAPYAEIGTSVRLDGVDEQAFNVSGELVFERHGRHLVMVIEPRLEQPPPVPKVRRPFSATIAKRENRLVVDLLEIRSPVEPGAVSGISRTRPGSRWRFYERRAPKRSSQSRFECSANRATTFTS